RRLAEPRAVHGRRLADDAPPARRSRARPPRREARRAMGARHSRRGRGGDRPRGGRRPRPRSGFDAAGGVRCAQEPHLPAALLRWPVPRGARRRARAVPGHRRARLAGGARMALPVLDARTPAVTPDRWRLVTDLFHAALAESDPGARTALVDEACAGDTAL